MINLITSNEIVKQRALGLSFDAIAEMTSVSKPTVTEICNSRIEDIEDARDIASTVSREEITKAINRRRAAYTKLVYKAIDELQGRDLSPLTTADLLRLINGIERALGVLDVKQDTTSIFTAPVALVKFVGEKIPNYLQDRTV